jgi:23S rRNA (adenine2503-C2)-methyltransferase
MDEHLRLYDLTYEQLAGLLAEWREPRFRASQVWNWLYHSLVDSYQAMGNLPPALRERLAAETDLTLLTPLAEQQSVTGETRKVLFLLRDGNTIESVLMSYYDRQTACISTQVGCGMGCIFCATGQGGLVRNLTAGEIVAQVLYLARELRTAAIAQAEEQGRHAELAVHPVTNVVFMGMGEPLANYAATRQAIETLADERGYNLGARHMTISTVGLVPGIQRLTDENLPVNLAISLHAADDELRDRLVPLNRRYPLAALMAAVHDYVEKTRRRVTIEYALIAGVNDSLEQAQALSALLGELLCHVNLIPLNPTPGSELQPSDRGQVEAFRSVLEQTGVPTTVRVRRGIDIEAGCGQLRRRQNELGIAAR